MRGFVLTLMLVATSAAVAHAQGAVPDLKGTWTGKGKSCSAPIPIIRVRRPPWTRRACATSRRPTWSRGRTAASPGATPRPRPPTQEPFAWAIASDNKTIAGADIDGYFQITLVSPDRMEKCYTQAAAPPSRAIVATCHMMDRTKR
jgi:hypothetical protein